MPGTVQAEDFDNGGEGVAYHDQDGGNNGGGYRWTDVDTWCNGVDCGIGWIGAGEWLEYTVNVTTSGIYTIEASVGAPANGGSFHIEIAGADVTGQMFVPNTGDWRTWTTIGKTGVQLNAGQYIVRVVMDTNNAAGAVCDFNHLRFIQTATQTPYLGTPRALPGIVQAEDFDEGGEGVAYHDLDVNNNGGGYRQTAVDTWCNGVDCGIGWIGVGEWLEYTVNVTTSGSYTVEASVGAPAPGGSFHIEVDGVNKTGTLQVPNTGDWRTWGTVTKADVTLAAGQHVIRVVMDTNNAWGAVCDFNYLRFTLSQTPYHGTASTLPGTVQAEDFDNGGEGVAYHDQDGGNNGGGYRWTDVDTWCNSVDCGIGWIGAGEWLEYTVNVAAAGSYTLQVRAGSPGPGGTFHIEVDGVDKTGPMNVPATGDWRTWGTVTKAGVQLSAGQQVIRVVMDAPGSNGGVCDLDSLTFTAQAAEYEIVARHTGKCLDVEAASNVNGARVQQWDCLGVVNQRWEVVPLGDGYHRIIARHSGKALDVSGISYDNGAGMVQWDYVGGANQQWQLIDVGSGYYRIMARHSGKALDVLGISRDNGAAVVQWDYLGSANQQWQLRAVTPGSDHRAWRGEWSAPAGWPFVAVHMHVLPNGKVLAWAGENVVSPEHRTDVWLWNPADGSFVEADNNSLDLFCSGHSFLPDGRLLVAGGHNHYHGPNQDQPVGEPHTSIFDFRNNSWTQGADMRAGRWYPTNTTLGSGEVLIASGAIDGYANVNDIPEVWQTNGTLRPLWNAPRRQDLYPWMHVAPNGQLFNSGPNQNTDYLDTSGNGGWFPVAGYLYSNFGHRDFGSSVMYAPGKVMIVGGGAPTASTEVIDLNQPGSGWRYVGAMAQPRRQLNATLLADGTVLATGGTSYPGFNDPNGAVFATEIWNPLTEQWSGMLSSMRIPRLYHSVAVLLPDGRVLSAGGGNGVNDDHPDAEIYSPPYLFKGARPQITSAPSSVGYNQTFFVGTPDTNISRMTLVRLSSVTHAYNQNQRFNDLTGSMQRVGGGVYVTTPANGNLCPPGHYMLFLLNDQGVPSVARIIQVSN
jgi:hypothetical protein